MEWIIRNCGKCDISSTTLKMWKLIKKLGKLHRSLMMLDLYVYFPAFIVSHLNSRQLAHRRDLNSLNPIDCFYIL
jgi:hypothetical protein